MAQTLLTTTLASTPSERRSRDQTNKRCSAKHLGLLRV